MGCAPSSIADGEDGGERVRSPGADEPERKESYQRLRSSSLGNNSATVASPASQNGSARHMPLLNNALHPRNSLEPDGTVTSQRSGGSLRGSARSNRSGRSNHRLSADDEVLIPGSVSQSDYLHDTADEQDMRATNSMGKPASSKELSINSLMTLPANTASNDNERQSSRDNIDQPNTDIPPELPNYVTENESLRRNLNTSERDVSESTHNERDFHFTNQTHENLSGHSEKNNGNTQGHMNHDITGYQTDNVFEDRYSNKSLENATAGEWETREEGEDSRSGDSPGLRGTNDFGQTQRANLSTAPLALLTEGSPKYGDVSKGKNIVPMTGKQHDRAEDQNYTSHSAEPSINGAETNLHVHYASSPGTILDAPKESSSNMRAYENGENVLLEQEQSDLPPSSQTGMNTFNYNHSPLRELMSNSKSNLPGTVNETSELEKTKIYSENLADSENNPKGISRSSTLGGSTADITDDLRAGAYDVITHLDQSQPSFGFSDAPTSALAAEQVQSRGAGSPEEHARDELLDARFTCFPNNTNDKSEEIVSVSEISDRVKEFESDVHNGPSSDLKGSNHTKTTPSQVTGASSNRPQSSEAVSISDLLSESDELDANLSTSAAALLAFPTRSSTAKYRRADALDRESGDHASFSDRRTPVESMLGEKEISSFVDTVIVPEDGIRGAGDDANIVTNQMAKETDGDGESIDNMQKTAHDKEMSAEQENRLAAGECDVAVAGASNAHALPANEGEEPQRYPRELSADSGFHHETFPSVESMKTCHSEAHTDARPSRDNIAALEDFSSDVLAGNCFDEENDEIELAALRGIEDIDDNNRSVPLVAEKHFSDMITDQVVFKGLPSMQTVNDYFVKQKEGNDDSDTQEGTTAHDFFASSSGINNSYELGQSFACSESGALKSLEDDTTDPTLYLGHNNSLSSSLEVHCPYTKSDLVSETSDSGSGKEGIFDHEDLGTDIDFDVCHDTIFEQYTDEESEATSSKWLFKLNLDSCTESTMKESSNDATPREPENSILILEQDEHPLSDEVKPVAKELSVPENTVSTEAIRGSDSEVMAEEHNNLHGKENDLYSFDRNTSIDELQQNAVENLVGQEFQPINVQHERQDNDLGEFGIFEALDNTGAASKEVIETSALNAMRSQNNDFLNNHNLNDANNDLFGEGLDQTQDKHKDSLLMNLNSAAQAHETSFPSQAYTEDEMFIADRKNEKTLDTTEFRPPADALSGNSNEEVKILDISKISDSSNISNPTDGFAPTGTANFSEDQELSRARDTASGVGLSESSSNGMEVLKFAEVRELEDSQEPLGDVNLDVVKSVPQILVFESNMKSNPLDAESLTRESNDPLMFNDALESNDALMLNDALKSTDALMPNDALRSNDALMPNDTLMPNVALMPNDGIIPNDALIPADALQSKDGQKLNKTHELALAQEVHETQESADSLDTIGMTALITVRQVITPQEAGMVDEAVRPVVAANFIEGTVSTKDSGMFEPNPVEPEALEAEASQAFNHSAAEDAHSTSPLKEEINHSSTQGDGNNEEKEKTIGSTLESIFKVSPSHGTLNTNEIDISASEAEPPPYHPHDPSNGATEEAVAPEYGDENPHCNEDDPQENFKENSLADYIANNAGELRSDSGNTAVISDDLTDQPFQNGISSPILAAGEDFIRNATSESDRVSIKNQINSLIAQEYRSRSNSPVTGLSNSRANSPTVCLQNATPDSSASNLPAPVVNLPPTRVSKALSNSSISRISGARSISPAISYNMSNSSASRLFSSNSRHSSPSLLMHNNSDSNLHAHLGSVS